MKVRDNEITQNGPAENKSTQEERVVQVEPGAKLPQEVVGPQEGTLWVDKATGNYIATLGSTQGIRAGDIIDIYDNDKLIGSAEVQKTQAAVSFVNLVGDIPLSKDKKYFRVVKP